MFITSLFIFNSNVMKRFVVKILLYILVLAFITMPIEIYKIKNAIVSIEEINGGEVYIAIKKAQTKTKIKRVLLGDSVGNQLYPCAHDYDSIVSLACNQAITMAGQYFLLKNFVEINRENLPEEVILLIRPSSLTNDVDECAYQYFLKPFPPHEYSRFYTKYLKERIHSIPFYWTANLPFIQTSNYSPRKAVPSMQSTKSMSKTSYEYLVKMYSLTLANNIAFRMVSAPVSENSRKSMESFWANLPHEYEVSLKPLLQLYRESVEFMPAEWYFDGIHFAKEKVPEDYLGLLSTD